MSLFREQFVCTDLYLRCSSKADFIADLKRFDSDKYISVDEEDVEHVIMQSYNHALSFAGDEIETEATYTTNAEGEQIIDTPATYTGNILINLRFHRKDHKELAEEFTSFDWNSIEVLPKPNTPNQTFG